jgi:hypothetical protein
MAHLSGAAWHPGAGPFVVRELGVVKDGNAAQFEEWLETHAQGFTDSLGRRSYRRPTSGQGARESLVAEWEAYGNRHFGPSLASFLTFFGAAEGRLGVLGGGAGMWDPMNDVPSNAYQMPVCAPRA